MYIHTLTSIISIGEMRICKSEADLKKHTGVEVQSIRNMERMDCTVIDGCAILWCITWPTSSPTNQALVKFYVESFKHYLQQWLLEQQLQLPMF